MNESELRCHDAADTYCNVTTNDVHTTMSRQIRHINHVINKPYKRPCELVFLIKLKNTLLLLLLSADDDDE